MGLEVLGSATEGSRNSANLASLGVALIAIRLPRLLLLRHAEGSELRLLAAAVLLEPRLRRRSDPALVVLEAAIAVNHEEQASEAEGLDAQGWYSVVLGRVAQVVEAAGDRELLKEHPRTQHEGPRRNQRGGHPRYEDGAHSGRRLVEGLGLGLRLGLGSGLGLGLGLGLRLGLGLGLG